MTIRTRHTRATLAQLYKLDSRRIDRADFGACDALIDLERAIDRTAFTKRQAQSIRLVFIEEKDPYEAAQELGITRQAVEQHIGAGIRKIAEADRYG